MLTQNKIDLKDRESIDRFATFLSNNVFDTLLLIDTTHLRIALELRSRYYVKITSFTLYKSTSNLARCASRQQVIKRASLRAWEFSSCLRCSQRKSYTINVARYVTHARWLSYYYSIFTICYKTIYWRNWIYMFTKTNFSTCNSFMLYLNKTQDKAST